MKLFAPRHRNIPLSPARGGAGFAPGSAPIFYGWVIVGAGIVITCLGMGTMMSLGIFLQPMSAATGWSRTSISIAALLNFLFMGPASFLWGAFSDRFGTRAVVLAGGALLGLGLVAASQAATVGEFQIIFGMLIGVAAGSFYAPLTATATPLVHPASQPRGRAHLGRLRGRLDDDIATGALAHHRLQLARGEDDAGRSLVAAHPSCRAVGAKTPVAVARRRHRGAGRPR
jgi:MFS family permease